MENAKHNLKKLSEEELKKIKGARFNITGYIMLSQKPLKAIAYIILLKKYVGDNHYAHFWRRLFYS